MEDKLDRILERLNQRINEWEGASVEAIEAGTTFKSFEAAMQKAHMDAGSSAAKAQTETRSKADWASYYKVVQLANLKAEKLKKQKLMEEKCIHYS